jgi:hypothetical protein
MNKTTPIFESVAIPFYFEHKLSRSTWTVIVQSIRISNMIGAERGRSRLWPVLAILLVLPSANPERPTLVAARSERVAAVAAAVLRLCGGAPARLANFHGQRRPGARAPPVDLASAVAAIVGLEPAPPAAREGRAGRAAGNRGRGRGAARGRGGGAVAQMLSADVETGRRAPKRATATGPVGEWAGPSASEGSPSKKSKPADAQLEEQRSSAAAPVKNAERETELEEETADSLVSSIEVELPPQRHQPLAVARREPGQEPAHGGGDGGPSAETVHGGDEEAHLLRAEQRRADLEVAMQGADFGGRELEQATDTNQEHVQTYWRDEEWEVAQANWQPLLGEGQEAALRESGDRIMLEDRMLACSPSQRQGTQGGLLMDSQTARLDATRRGSSGGEEMGARAELVVDGFVQRTPATVSLIFDEHTCGAAAAERRARWSLAVARERACATAIARDGTGAEGAIVSEGMGKETSLLSGQEETVRYAARSAAELRLRGVEVEMCRRRALQRVQLLRVRLAQEEETRRQEQELKRVQEEEARERRQREEEEARVLEASYKLREEEEVLDLVALTAAALRALQLDRCRDSLGQGWRKLEAIFHRRQLLPASPTPYSSTYAPTILHDHMLRILWHVRGGRGGGEGGGVDENARSSYCAARSLVQVVKALGKLGALLNIRSEQVRGRNIIHKKNKMIMVITDDDNNIIFAVSRCVSARSAAAKCYGVKLRWRRADTTKPMRF